MMGGILWSTCATVGGATGVLAGGEGGGGGYVVRFFKDDGDEGFVSFLSCRY